MFAQSYHGIGTLADHHGPCRCEIYSLWETMISLESSVFYVRKRITSPAGPDVIIFLDALVPEYLIPLS